MSQMLMDLLYRAGLLIMHSLLRQHRLRWLSHICTMEDGRIPKDILHKELAQGKLPIARPHLPFKDEFKRDLVHIKINTNSWKLLAGNRVKWRPTVHEHIMASEARRHELAAEMRRSHALRTHKPVKAQLSQTLTSVACAADNASPEASVPIDVVVTVLSSPPSSF